MGRFDGKVAFITGVPRGQDRSRAVRLAGVHPTGVATPMVLHPQFETLIAEHPEAMSRLGNVMGVELIEAVDITNAVVWLCSDEARFVTGVNLPVDAGFMVV